MASLYENDDGDSDEEVGDYTQSIHERIREHPALKEIAKDPMKLMRALEGSAELRESHEALRGIAADTKAGEWSRMIATRNMLFSPVGDAGMNDLAKTTKQVIAMRRAQARVVEAQSIARAATSDAPSNAPFDAKHSNDTDAMLRLLSDPKIGPHHPAAHLALLERYKASKHRNEPGELRVYFDSDGKTARKLQFSSFDDDWDDQIGMSMRDLQDERNSKSKKLSKKGDKVEVYPVPYLGRKVFQDGLVDFKKIADRSVTGNNRLPNNLAVHNAMVSMPASNALRDKMREIHGQVGSVDLHSNASVEAMLRKVHPLLMSNNKPMTLETALENKVAPAGMSAIQLEIARMRSGAPVRAPAEPVAPTPSKRDKASESSAPTDNKSMYCVIQHTSVPQADRRALTFRSFQDMLDKRYPGASPAVKRDLLSAVNSSLHEMGFDMGKMRVQPNGDFINTKDLQLQQYIVERGDGSDGGQLRATRTAHMANVSSDRVIANEYDDHDEFGYILSPASGVKEVKLNLPSGEVSLRNGEALRYTSHILNGPGTLKTGQSSFTHLICVPHDKPMIVTNSDATMRSQHFKQTVTIPHSSACGFMETTESLLGDIKGGGDVLRRQTAILALNK